MILLDSSFLIAHHNTRDVHHAAARMAMERFLAGEWGRGILLEYVFLEVVTVLAARRGLRIASDVARILLEAEELDFLPCSDFFLETLEAFCNQEGTALSFTDAALVTAARKWSVALIATFDADFLSLAGITVVPD